MTIERNMFVDKPFLATVEEGTEVAQRRYFELVGRHEAPGTITRMLSPEGEFNLLPHYLRGKRSRYQAQGFTKWKGRSSYWR